MARRGNHSLFVSDNAKTFKNTAKWQKKADKDPDLNDMLVKNRISWKFNIPREVHGVVDFLKEWRG